MNDDTAVNDHLVERMLHRRADRGDLTGLERSVREAVERTPQDRRGWWGPASRAPNRESHRSRYAVAGAAAIIVIGFAQIIKQGGPKLGVDFSGGTAMVLRFERPVTEDAASRLGAGIAMVAIGCFPRGS